MPEPVAPRYRTSSFSDKVNCLEVHLGDPDEPVRVRDSKDRGRPPIAFPAGPWQNFVSSLRAGEFARR